MAEELHFGRAAARLDVAQPTVSVAIRDLERLLGVELLTRSTRTVAVTPAGEILLVQARDILSASRRLWHTAASIGQRASGTFVVGLHDEGAAELTVPLLEAFTRAEPGLRIVVRTLEYSTAHASLADGGADAVLSGGTWSEDYAVETLFHDQRGIVVGPHHPAYEADELRFADVADEPLFSTEDTNREAESFFDRFTFSDHRNGEAFRQAGVVRQFSELLLHIELGCAANAATASTQRFTSFGTVRYVPVVDAAPVRVSAAIPARGATAAQRSFLRVARETADELADRLVPSAVPAPAADGTG